MRALVLVALFACGLPPVKPPTAVEACDRAAECRIDALAQREACVFCIDCLLTLNPELAKHYGSHELQAATCEQLDALSARAEIPQCVQSWVPGGLCVSGGRK